MPLTVRRRLPAALATIVAVAVLLTSAALPAAAEPNSGPNEGTSAKVKTLRTNLEAAAVGYLQAQEALDVSRKRQRELTATLLAAENKLARLRAGVAGYAAEAYKTGRLGVMGAMLNATSPDDLLARSAALERMSARDDAALAELGAVTRQAAQAKAGIDTEVKEQARQTSELAKRKKAAELALSAVGGYATRGWVDPNSPLAAPARRNADGSWPGEGCTINDPSTSGCITPRTLHALQQSQKAGFKRHVSCYRPGDMYEHPKGRACDFSSEVDGFKNFSSTGESKLYGDKLASYLVKNASRLGVLYVIFYCKIWLPATGWKTYSPTGSRCGDDPAGDHTNHVHLSMY
ncbi:coiled-coil domain-containing protein [Catellatospora methionotrophica]|uniref:coiled-coil domain-containing protein n=1 Tax=Catellatospora methionotrophica TaxID=121620 RepID=UPI0033F7AB38